MLTNWAVVIPSGRTGHIRQGGAESDAIPIPIPIPLSFQGQPDLRRKIPVKLTLMGYARIQVP